MSGPIAVVRGKDGRVLGVTFDGDKCLEPDFLEYVASLAFSRIPEDSESPHAKRLIAKDNDRLFANGGGK